MPHVLIIHMGGTLGMSGTPLEPGAYAARVVDTVPELGQLADVGTEIVCNLDSSDVTPAEWTRVAETIENGYDDYDGFVVIHGTDTMAYTASALAFALRNLDKPVVLTGAQRPLSALRTDARRNLADAVDLATHDIPEVGICFDGLFLRGCRATKSNIHDYRAFDSPGTEPLARLGVDVEVRDHLRTPDGPFVCRAEFDPNVFVLPVTPGLNPSVLRAASESGGVHGIVLAAFGTGTVPTSSRAIAPVVAEVVDEGIDVVVVTQSAGAGAVELDLYKNSRPLAEAGAIAGGGMRVEAALAKLMHGLANFSDRDDRRVYLARDVAGELP